MAAIGCAAHEIDIRPSCLQMLRDIGHPAGQGRAVGEIRAWFAVFLRRFFEQSQFKRSCIPNAPKVGSGGSLSPRGDYRAPSDSEATVWLEEIKNIPDQDLEAGS